ncbi:MAG TPA: hypothetical protein K8V00_02890 [Ligilactobacillus acidipiscis]|uniref:Uncharacterized protein n=1 Tax=Ligilactobacillus acidipiscis TaxID=89059 RepID=A0A921F9U6_9LACO|nr:hypothetical protein [Ligilactobacillus acidipiscis]
MEKEETLLNLQKNNPYYVGVEKVIHISTRVGDGSEKNPVRLVEHFYDIDGQLLFESE